MGPKVAIYDTTLRDGSQAEGISFSTEDKLEIMHRLDAFGVDFIEGGWPASNPKDEAFFRAAKKAKLQNSKLVSFGSTRKGGVEAEKDQNLIALLDSGTEWICIFGKSWDLHVRDALKVSLEENLRMVEESISFLRSKGRRVIFDAEHFFDGWKDSHDYAMQVIESAAKAGAEWLVLCDTNGGTMTSDVKRAVEEVRNTFDVPIGIHCHNDCDLAVANSLLAVECGANMVQGTINGFGERCGNANLCSIIPNLGIKMGRDLNILDMSALTPLARFVNETLNLSGDPKLPYVGKSAFAHKAGIHVSAMMKNQRSYEHIDPAVVGNMRRMLVSELSGTASVMAKLKDLGIDAEKESGRSILEKIKVLESEGFQFEGADASFELLVRRLRDGQKPPFKLEGFRIFVDVSGSNISSEASIKVIDSKGGVEHTAANGNGPVNALDRALRKALERFYPEIGSVRLTDYKVRVIDGKDATAANVRVLITSTDGVNSWTTVGVSSNIIEASLMAMLDSVEYKLMKVANGH